MTNNYVGSGVLVLDRVTPIITALFGDFHLADCPGEGRANITLIPDTATPCWEAILLRLSRLGADLGILPGEAPVAGTVLSAWIKHFHAEQDEALLSLLDHHRFEGAVILDDLFPIASLIDDGHRLTAIEFEGCWCCSKLRPFKFGGHACFFSREVRLSDSSSEVREFGIALNTALSKGDIADASELVTLEISRLLDSIQNITARDTVRQRVIERLAELPDARTTE